MKNPSDFPFKLIQMEMTLEVRDTILRLYYEQTAEEKNLQKRVVGGCGVRLENKPIEVEPNAYPMLDHLHGRLANLSSSKMLSISTESAGILPGVFFKLGFGSHPQGDESAKKPLWPTSHHLIPDERSD